MERDPHTDPVLTAMPVGEAAEQRVRTAIRLDELQNKIACEALAAWQQLRGTRRMPSRADMSPKAMRGFLKFVAIAQVLEGGRDFRYRIVGDVVNIQQGLPLQGMTTSDLDARIPGYGTQLCRAYQRVVRKREALAYRGLYYRPADGHTFKHEAIMAPLGDDGENADHVIIVAA